ncbi:hypothetical protein KOSB73_350065 [Klebsiella grimontii]|uniref:Uncharacterized protein n=1 Tax=Klebsiella grimontii TaxID=2058152 RepID=A0A285B946_9ENTR|nr:hypothetical protein KOSB73_350065 [Klebsiella grimontii]
MSVSTKLVASHLTIGYTLFDPYPGFCSFIYAEHLSYQHKMPFSALLIREKIDRSTRIIRRQRLCILPA